MHYNLPVHCGGKRYGTKKAKTDGRNSIGQFGGERDLGSAVIMFFNAERMNVDLMGMLYCPGARLSRRFIVCGRHRRLLFFRKIRMQAWKKGKCKKFIVSL